MWRPRNDGMPAPRTIKVSCGCVPAGISSSTGPRSTVSTCTVVPSAASGAATSTAVTRSSPSRTNRGSSRTRISTYRSPGGPPRSPAWPRPAIRIRCPSAMPAGTSTLTFGRSTLRPRPRHTLHGSRATFPSPWHTSQTAVRITWPNGVRVTALSCPLPWQREQVSIGVPGSAPLPRQCSHTADRLVADLDLGPAGRLDEVDLGRHRDVAALHRTRGPAATAHAEQVAERATAAEERLEDVRHRAERVEVRRVAAAAQALAAVPVVGRAAFGVRQHLVGLGSLLELLLGVRVVPVDVRVKLAGELAERALDRPRRRRHE